MSDLISRDKVLEIIAPRLNSSKIGSLEYQRLYSISEETKNIPIAFDLESVIKDLESKLERANLQLEIASDFSDKDSLRYKNDIIFFRERAERYEEFLEILKSAVNATNGKNGG